MEKWEKSNNKFIQDQKNVQNMMKENFVGIKKWYTDILFIKQYY